MALGQSCLSSWLPPYCSHHSPRFALFGTNELNDVNKLTKKTQMQSGLQMCVHLVCKVLSEMQLAV